MVSMLHCKCNQGVKVQVAQQRLWWSPDRYGILTTRHRPGVKMVGFEQTHLGVTPACIFGQVRILVNWKCRWAKYESMRVVARQAWKNFAAFLFPAQGKLADVQTKQSFPRLWFPPSLFWDSSLTPSDILSHFQRFWVFPPISPQRRWWWWCC